MIFRNTSPIAPEVGDVEVLVTYDICTTSVEGKHRLRAVAKICEGYGLRVQNSVFECHITKADLRTLVDQLSRTIDETVDRVGFYRISEPSELLVTVLGRGPEIEWSDPLVL